MKSKQQLKNLNKAELGTKIGDLEKQIATALLDRALGKLKNNRLIFNLRKQMAVAKTYENNSR